MCNASSTAVRGAHARSSSGNRTAAGNGGAHAHACGRASAHALCLSFTAHLTQTFALPGNHVQQYIALLMLHRNPPRTPLPNLCKTLALNCEQPIPTWHPIRPPPGITPRRRGRIRTLAQRHKSLSSLHMPPSPSGYLTVIPSHSATPAFPPPFPSSSSFPLP